jgi:alkylglycerol monooxygenase
MDLIALAVPFFLLAIVIELIVDKVRGTGLFRANDAINSLSAGILSTTTGYFTKLLPLIAWGFVLQNFALIDMPLEWFDLSATGIALWVTAALAWDFCYYWFHRFSHEISILWAAHAVHHQSEDYNLTTALRQTSTGFLFGWLFYLPLFLIGFPLEVILVVNAVNLIYQFWVHTQVVRRMGVLDYILVTPSNHRVHHAQNERYIDKNYGGMLILWDRMFGTFQDELDTDPVVFGIRKPLSNWNPIWANFQVYDYLLFDSLRTRRWRDKIGVWFGRTGWRPDDMAAKYPKARSELSRFAKFDACPAPGLRGYVLAQFAIALLFALGIVQLFTQEGLSAVVVPCLMLWAQLWTIGILNEGRDSAWLAELVRLLILVPGGAALLEAPNWPAVIAYIGLSSAWLLIGKNKLNQTLIDDN